MSADLMTWLRAHLDEDERVARRAPRTWRSELMILHEAQAHVARFDPARMLREVEAKRRILNSLPSWNLPARPEDDEPEYAYGYARGLYEAIQWLAVLYADQPGYLDEWRP